MDKEGQNGVKDWLSTVVTYRGIRIQENKNVTNLLYDIHLINRGTDCHHLLIVI